jgi:hypothetical protein
MSICCMLTQSDPRYLLEKETFLSFSFIDINIRVLEQTTGYLCRSTVKLGYNELGC